MAQTKLTADDISSVPRSALPTFAGSEAGAVPVSTGGTTSFLRADGAWATPPSGGSPAWGAITGTLSSQMDLQTALNGKQTAGSYLTANQSITLSGDASGTGSTAITVTLPNVNTNVGTFNNLTVNAKGLVTSASNVAYLTGNQSITISGDGTGSGTTAITLSIPTFAGSAKGLVPVSAGGSTNFLRADGTWAAPAGGGGGVTSIIAGDGITISGSTGAVTISDTLPITVAFQRLTGNYTNSTVTATNVFTGITTVANAVYHVEMEATTQCSSTGGTRWSVVAPAGSTVAGWTEGVTTGTATMLRNRITAINTLSATAHNRSANTPASMLIRAIVVTGATTGTLTIGGASVTATQVTTVFTNSSLRITRIA